jgi:MerR family mercuric resistance operon transcriptional regulator
MKRFTIGKLSNLTGVERETIRFYEKIGLLIPPERTKSGYRVYNEETVKQLEHIKTAKSLGFSLNEIAEQLTILNYSESMLLSHQNEVFTQVNEIDTKIKALLAIKQNLLHTQENMDIRCSACTCPLLKLVFPNQDN